MYLFNIDAFIRQLLPPHWRHTYRYAVLQALLAPIGRIYEQWNAFRKDLQKDINLNAQVGVLEGYLNRKYAIGYGKHIEITDGDTPSSVKILVKREYMPRLEAIKADVMRFLPMGVRAIYMEKITN